MPRRCARSGAMARPTAEIRAAAMPPYAAQRSIPKPVPSDHQPKRWPGPASSNASAATSASARPALALATAVRRQPARSSGTERFIAVGRSAGAPPASRAGYAGSPPRSASSASYSRSVRGPKVSKLGSGCSRYAAFLRPIGSSCVFRFCAGTSTP